MHMLVICLHPVSCIFISDRRSVSVLVPGAGLGRLAHEFARRGYNCQGNEWSLFMLIASNFVLNRYVGDVRCTV